MKAQEQGWGLVGLEISTPEHCLVFTDGPRTKLFWWVGWASLSTKLFPHWNSSLDSWTKWKCCMRLEEMVSLCKVYTLSGPPVDVSDSKYAAPIYRRSISTKEESDSKSRKKWSLTHMQRFIFLAKDQQELLLYWTISSQLVDDFCIIIQQGMLISSWIRGPIGLLFSWRNLMFFYF